MIDKKYIEMTGFSADQVQTGKTAGADAQASNKIMQDALGLISSNPDALKNAVYDKITQSWKVDGQVISDQAAVSKISELKYAQNEAQGNSQYAASQVLQEKGIAAMTSEQLSNLPAADLKANTIPFTGAMNPSDITNSILEKGSDGNPSLNDSQVKDAYSKFGIDPATGNSTKLVEINGVYYKASGSMKQTDRGSGKPDLRNISITLTPVKGTGSVQTVQLSGFNNSGSFNPGGKKDIFGFTSTPR